MIGWHLRNEPRSNGLILCLLLGSFAAIESAASVRMAGMWRVRLKASETYGDSSASCAETINTRTDALSQASSPALQPCTGGNPCCSHSHVCKLTLDESMLIKSCIAGII